MSIPADQLVEVFPAVLSAGGAALALSGLVLTNNTAVPIGTVLTFPDADSVGKFFGYTAVEYTDFAVPYFKGYDNSTAKPGALLFAQYAVAPVAGYMRSASFSGEPLTTITSIAPGTLTLTIDNGTPKVSSSINLSTATSFANAASLIQAAFTGAAPLPVVTFDAQRQSFLFTSPTTGATSSVSFGTGAIADALRLTGATAAVTSAGSAAMTPATAMPAIKAKSMRWASFATVFEPLVDDKLAFATWNSSQKNRFAYVVWDTDPNAKVQGNTTDFVSRAKVLGLAGSVPVTGDQARAAAQGVSLTTIVRPLAAFMMGIAASLDFTAVNGRQTWAYRSQTGLQPSVDDATVATTLIAKGYNFYGDYATSSDQFSFLQRGVVTGAFKFTDSYYNQIWMNARFQQSYMIFLSINGSVPYTDVGYSGLETAIADDVAAALTFGAIRAGVTLSSTQALYINSTTGKQVSNIVSTRGWYLNVADPGPIVRADRGSPDMAFFYADGGSIQKIELASVNVQ